MDAEQLQRFRKNALHTIRFAPVLVVALRGPVSVQPLSRAAIASISVDGRRRWRCKLPLVVALLAQAHWQDLHSIYSLLVLCPADRHGAHSRLA